MRVPNRPIGHKLQEADITLCIAAIMEQHGDRSLAISAGTSKLLQIVLDRSRMLPVNMATVYEFLKDFAGPIATIIAAGTATFVTYKLGSNQVSIAREQARFPEANSRSAQQKLILDLFDKRWSIVTELREAVAEVMTTGAVSYDAS